MKNRICLVTGANAGIGFVTARELARLGATTVLVCRNAARGEAARDKIVTETGNESTGLLLCDLSSQASIRRLVKRFAERYGALHVLINNAAMYTGKRSLTSDGIEIQFATNYLSCYLLSRLLLDLMLQNAPARIVNVSTTNHFDVSLDLTDLQSERDYDAKPVHMRSKLAVIVFTLELARRLRGTTVTANCLHPGVIATNLLGQVREIPEERRFTAEMGGAPVDEGATTPVYLASSAEVDGISGKYFEDCAAVLSSAESRDEELAKELWRISAELTGFDD